MIIFCILYYIFSLSQTIPCIVKLLKTKKSGDYSLNNRLLQYLALVCWTIYLTSTLNWQAEWYLFVIGIIDLLFLTLENVLILKYYDFKKSEEKK